MSSTDSEASSATSGLTLLCRLDDFDSAGEFTFFVTDLVPPSLKHIPYKLAFLILLNIINNYVRKFPMDELEFHARAAKAKGSRCFMSWFRKS